MNPLPSPTNSIHHGYAYGSSSALSGMASMGESLGDLANVDVAQNHGIGCAPVRGRESHTADLDEFDRYVRILETEREQLIQLELLEREREKEGAAADGDEGDDDDDAGSLGDDVSRTTPFNADFWSYVRSILAHAKPVGFNELDDPNGVVPMGPDDSNAFIQKAVGIGPVNPISPSALAEGGNFTEEEVLTELLYATRAGAVRMQFAPECDRCGSVVTARDRLGDIPPAASCEGCNFPNKVDSLDKIKVLFLLNDDILYILADNFACTPSQKGLEKTAIFATVPATFTGSGFRYSVGVGGDKELRPALEPGKYRMHCPVARTDNYLIVKREAEETDEPYKLELKVSGLVCESAVCPPLEVLSSKSRQSSIDNAATEHRRGLKELTVPHGKLHFDVLPDTRSFFVLWVQEDDDDDVLMRLPEEERSGYTKATTVVHNHVFNRLFANQVVSANPDALLSIRTVVLVFTDVVGSTDMYASTGDGPALQLIRKHFRVLFGAFTKRGRVVKTVGDAVMASFTTGRAAMEAVADALRLLPQQCVMPDGSPLQIRVGIHCGPAIVVPVNGVNDYFGQTVNVAARVEAAAKASECFVTEDVMASDPDARSAYYEIISPTYMRRGSSSSLGAEEAKGKKIFDATPECDLNLKGVSGVVRARGFRLHSRPRRASDAFGGAQPHRNLRRSQMYDRLSISGISVDDSDDEGVNSRGNGRSSYRLDGLQEEGGESDRSSSEDERFTIEGAEKLSRKT